MHAYIHACIHVSCMRQHLSVCIYIYKCIRIYIYTYVYIYEHACIHTSVTKIHTNTHITYIHTYIYTHIHAQGDEVLAIVSLFSTQVPKICFYAYKSCTNLFFFRVVFCFKNFLDYTRQFSCVKLYLLYVISFCVVRSHEMSLHVMRR